MLADLFGGVFVRNLFIWVKKRFIINKIIMNKKRVRIMRTLFLGVGK